MQCKFDWGVVKMPKTKVNDVDIYYQVQGQGEPLVLIQGLGGAHSAWGFQTRAFKKHYRVITFDNRGVGKTSRSSAPYTIRTMAEDTIGLLNHLGIDKAQVLGMSLGGIIAQEIAINHPNRVMKLILVCTSAGEREIAEIHPKMLSAIGVKEGSMEVDFSRVDPVRSMAVIISLAFNRRLYRIPLLLGFNIFLKRSRGGAPVEQIEAVAGHSTIDRLHLITAPTLVITGTGDRVIPPHSSEVIAGRIPNAKLVKVEGGSHAFFIEMRGRFNREVLDFLSHD